MNKSDIIRDMKSTFHSAGFITRKQLADYMGVKDSHSVDKYLFSLERVNDRYYFIPDVVEQLKAK